MAGKKIRNALYDLEQSDFAGKEVKFVQGGLGPSLAGLPRDYVAVRQLFQAMVDLGYLTDGSKPGTFNNLKYRQNEARITDSVVEVPLGLVWFQAQKDDLNRSESAHTFLQAAGQLQGEKWMSYARILGAAFVPVTKDGSVVVGPRISDMYNGWLNAGAGFVDANSSEEPSLKLFAEVAKRKLGEVGKAQVIPGTERFVGIASHPVYSDGDATWVGRLDVRDNYFTSGKWKEDSNPDRPSEVILLNQAKVKLLLDSGVVDERKFPGIMYSTDLGLASLVESDFARLE